jgi:hypothetical protein
MTDEQFYLLFAEVRALREALERAAGLIVEPPAGKKGKTVRVRRHLSLDFVTVAEVADYCCVSVSTVSHGVRVGMWPFNFLRQVRIGSRVLFSRASFFHMGRAMRRAAESDPGGWGPAHALSPRPSASEKKNST